MVSLASSPPKKQIQPPQLTKRPDDKPVEDFFVKSLQEPDKDSPVKVGDADKECRAEGWPASPGFFKHSDGQNYYCDGQNVHKISQACIKRYKSCPAMHETLPAESKPVVFEDVASKSKGEPECNEDSPMEDGEADQERQAAKKKFGICCNANNMKAIKVGFWQMWKLERCRCQIHYFS